MGGSTSVNRFLFSLCWIAKTELSIHIFNWYLSNEINTFANNLGVEPTIFFIEKISFYLKLFAGHFYGQSFIKTVRGPLIKTATQNILFHLLRSFIVQVQFKPSSYFLTDHSKAVLLLWIFLLFVFVFVILSCLFLQPCGRLLKRGWPLGSLVCDVFLCFVTFPYGVLGHVWYLIISIPDLCHLS